MTEQQIKSLTSALRVDRILFDEPIKSHTFFKQNGKAKLFFEAKNTFDLELAVSLSIKNKIPFVLVGTGSETILPDNFSDYLLIKNSCRGIRLKGFRTSTNTPKNTPEVLVQVESGVTLTMLSRYCAHEGLTGLEFLQGIPGTVGGGIKNNVGAMPTVKNFLGNFVYLAEIIEVNTAKKKLVNIDFFNFDYGRTSLQGTKTVIVQVVLKLQKNSIENQTANFSKNIIFTGTNLLTGPVFINISHKDAVRLSTKHFTLSPSYIIRQLELKENIFGKVSIYPDDPNRFILESGFASDDVSRLIRYIRKHAREVFSLNLEPRVDIIKFKNNK